MMTVLVLYWLEQCLEGEIMTVTVARRLSAGALRNQLFPSSDAEFMLGDNGVMLDSICAFGGNQACSSHCINIGFPNGGYCDSNNDCHCS